MPQAVPPPETLPFSTSAQRSTARGAAVAEMVRRTVRAFSLVTSMELAESAQRFHGMKIGYNHRRRPSDVSVCFSESQIHCPCSKVKHALTLSSQPWLHSRSATRPPSQQTSNLRASVDVLEGSRIAESFVGSI